MAKCRRLDDDAIKVPARVEERLENAMLWGALLPFLDDKDIARVFNCCHFFRDSTPLVARALASRAVGPHLMTRCAMDWCDLLPRVYREARAGWRPCVVCNPHKKMRPDQEQGKRDEGPEWAGDSHLILPTFSLVSFEKPARLLSLVGHINSDVVPSCVHNMYMYHFRPLLLPLALPSGANGTTTSDDDTVRHALNNLLPGFGDSFVDTGLVRSDLGVHWDNLVVGEDGQVQCNACAFAHNALDEYKRKVAEIDAEMDAQAREHGADLGWSEAEIQDVRRELRHHYYPPDDFYAPHILDSPFVLGHVVNALDAPADLEWTAERTRDPSSARCRLAWSSCVRTRACRSGGSSRGRMWQTSSAFRSRGTTRRGTRRRPESTRMMLSCLAASARRDVSSVCTSWVRLCESVSGWYYVHVGTAKMVLPSFYFSF